MADIYDRGKRSEIMSHIRSTNTKPEVSLRKTLFSRGLRYRINDKRLAGRPDIVLPKYRTVIFVHGCFWHGHEYCKYAYKPKSNTDFWEQKILKNRERDKSVIDSLQADGWAVITIWECEIKTKEKLFDVASRIETELKKQG